MRDVLLSSIAALMMIGCQDPAVGDWEAEEQSACGTRSDFTVDDELGVDGTIIIEDSGQGGCLSCDFKGDAENVGDDRYEVDIDFENCDCVGDTSATAECDLRDDTMSCKLDFDACGTFDEDFERQD
jgi:hypothetical protein